MSSLPRAMLRLKTSGSWCPGSDPFFSAISFLLAVGNYTQAIECAKTYLLFFPNDEVMNQNLAYYTAMLGEEPARSIGPREVRDLRLLGQLPAEPRPEGRRAGGGRVWQRSCRGWGPGREESALMRLSLKNQGAALLSTIRAQKSAI